MSVFILQIIAMCTMLIDHMGALFFDNALMFRAIGRIAFPLYAFLLANGFTHYFDDKDRVKNHLSWLLISTVLSELSYDLVQNHLSFSELFISQSIMFTLLLSFLGMLAMHTWKNNVLVLLSIVLVTFFIANAMNCEYKIAGILLIYLYYFYSLHLKDLNYIKRLAILLGLTSVFVMTYWFQVNKFTVSDTLFNPNLTWTVYLLNYIAPVIILSFYSGKKGYSNRTFRLSYKIFYPLHLFILGLIKHIAFI